ncbi:MAG: class I SAM-dependent methyltransferase [Burkholderiaceae bacterium]
MEHQSSQKSIIALGPWLETAAGSYVRRWEQSRFDELTADIFGFNAVQIGLPQIAALQASRMPNKWLSDSIVLHHMERASPGAGHVPPAATTGMDRVEPKVEDGAPVSGHDSRFDVPNTPTAIVLDYSELPFASQSLDLIVLPHVLEFATEPHQVLREVERVLIPEGQLIVCGFNPASLWGARQLGGRLTGTHFLPPGVEFISVPRMKDWLKLLNMEVRPGHFGCYAPPCATATWLKRYAFMEKAGNRWWPYVGAVYMLQAIKRVKGMRLIGPAWKRRPVSAPHAVPATNRSTQRRDCQTK